MDLNVYKYACHVTLDIERSLHNMFLMEDKIQSFCVKIGYFKVYLKLIWNIINYYQS